MREKLFGNQTLSLIACPRPKGRLEKGCFVFGKEEHSAPGSRLQASVFSPCLQVTHCSEVTCSVKGGAFGGTSLIWGELGVGWSLRLWWEGAGPPLFPQHSPSGAPLNHPCGPRASLLGCQRTREEGGVGRQSSGGKPILCEEPGFWEREGPLKKENVVRIRWPVSRVPPPRCMRRINLCFGILTEKSDLKSFMKSV